MNLKAGELYVRQRADRFNEIGEPKSEAGHRCVPFSAFVANTLREWKLACPKSDLDLVFPNGAGKVESLANIINRGLVPAQIAAGVVDDSGKAKYTGMHALRHFYASWCINRPADGGLGLPRKVIQERLGHSSITMTYDRYGHLVLGLLYHFRDSEANLRSAWICSRNDVLGNLGVLAAALGVFGTGTLWPDVIVASVMAVLGLQGSWIIVQQSLPN